MINYLGCITCCQYYLFHLWINQRKALILNGFDSVTTFNEFTNRSFNYCCEDCTSDETSFFLNLMANVDQDFKVWILLAFSMFFFAFHLIESLLDFILDTKPIEMILFIYGKPNTQTIINNEPNHKNNLELVVLEPKIESLEADQLLDHPKETNQLLISDEPQEQTNILVPGGIESDATLKQQESSNILLSITNHDLILEENIENVHNESFSTPEKDETNKEKESKLKQYVRMVPAIFYFFWILCFPLVYPKFMFERNATKTLIETWGCRTTDLSPCSFPFRFNNEIYHGCVNDYGTSWCALDADRLQSGSEQNFKNKGACQQDCPGGNQYNAILSAPGEASALLHLTFSSFS